MQRDTPDARVGDLVLPWSEERWSWIVVETDASWIDLRKMLVNYRLVEVHKAEPQSYQRSWCYQGLSQASFTTAVLAAKAWGGDLDTEPAGWLKSWDGRYGGSLAGDPYLRH